MNPYAKEFYLCANCEEACSEDEKGTGYCRVCLPETIVALERILGDLVDCDCSPAWSEPQFKALADIVAYATNGRGQIAWRGGAPRLPERTGRAK